MLNESRSHGIQGDVSKGGMHLGIRGDVDIVEAGPKQVARPLMPPIEVPGVTAKDIAHDPADREPVAAQDQMDVVAHEAVRQTAKRPPVDRVTESPDKATPIVFVQEDVALVHPSRREVVALACRQLPGHSWHDDEFSR
jgi:hypothetical protein